MNKSLQGVVLTDGTKSIPLSQLPEEAWTYLSGQPQDGKLSPLSAYQKVPWLYRAIDLRAKAVSAMPYAILRDQQDVTESADVAGIRRTLRRNLFLTEAALCIYAASYLVKEQNLYKKNLTPRWFLPTTITPQYNAQSGLVGFKRRVPGKSGVFEKEYAVDELVYCWLPSLASEVGPGVAPAAVALAAAGVLHNLQQFLRAYFERGAIKATLLTVEGNPSRPELDKLEAWWRRFFRGVQKAWESAAIKATVKPVVIGEGVKELSNTDLTNEQREEIATAIGVPATILFSGNARGLGGGGVAAQDDRHFYTKTVIPQCALIAECFNEQLFEPLGLTLEFQPEQLEVMQQAELEKAEQVQKAVGKPILTRNEGRDLMGYDPIEAWDEADIEPPPPVVTVERPPKQLPGGNEEDERADEMKRWEKKALKALRRGDSPAVSFESEHIDERSHKAIAAALTGATDVAEVRAAFSVLPFRHDWAAYP